MKRIFYSLGFCMLLCFFFFNQAEAMDEVAVGREFLIDHGFLEEVVNTYSDELVLELYESYKDDTIVCLSSQKQFVMEGNDEGIFHALGSIPSADLTLTISAVGKLTDYNVSLNGNRIAQVEVVVSYQWAEGYPAYKGKDAIIVSWESADFVLSTAPGFFAGKAYAKSLAGGTVYTTYSGKDNDACFGVNSLSWEFPLEIYNSCSRYGFGRILFLPAYTMYFYGDTSKNTNASPFSAQYGHGKTVLNSNLSVSSGGSVSAAFQTAADDRTVSLTFGAADKNGHKRKELFMIWYIVGFVLFFVLWYHIIKNGVKN